MIIERKSSHRKNLRLVEFCAGSGSVGLVLAALYPQHHILLLDNKAGSLEIAQDRISRARLKNVELRQMNIEDFDESFDLGLGLHACGGATDIIIEKSLSSQAAFVTCSCCVGKVLFHRSDPLCSSFKTVLNCNCINNNHKQKKTRFPAMIRAADFGHSSDLDISHTLINRQRR